MPNNIDNQPVFLYRRGAARIQSTPFRCQFERVCVCGTKIVPRMCFSLCAIKRELDLGFFHLTVLSLGTRTDCYFCLCVWVNRNWCGRSPRNAEEKLFLSFPNNRCGIHCIIKSACKRGMFCVMAVLWVSLSLGSFTWWVKYSIYNETHTFSVLKPW